MIIHGIDTKDISVVVQGAIDKTKITVCIQSIRENLPGSEILISTWDDQDTQGLDYDELIKSRDPGGFPLTCQQDSKLDATNRMLIAMNNALVRIKNKYTVRIRSDCFLVNNNFLTYYNQYTIRDKSFSFFNERVLCSSIYTRNPRINANKLMCVPYAVSDIFLFGLTSDLQNYFNSPLIDDEEYKNYFKIYPHKFSPFVCRFVAEQYLWMAFLKRCGIEELNCEHLYDINHISIILTEKSIANNLVIVSPEELGLSTLKSELFTSECAYSENCYSYKEWRYLYKAYSEKNILYLIYFKLFFSGKNLKLKFMRTLKNIRKYILKLLYRISPTYHAVKLLTDLSNNYFGFLAKQQDYIINYIYQIEEQVKRENEYLKNSTNKLRIDLEFAFNRLNMEYEENHKEISLLSNNILHQNDLLNIRLSNYCKDSFEHINNVFYMLNAQLRSNYLSQQLLFENFTPLLKCEINSTFSNHYEYWRIKRIGAIVDYYGEDWFKNKRILELGCGYGDIGLVFKTLGAEVTFVEGRKENCDIIKKRFPNSTIYNIDLEKEWPFQNEIFDLVLNMGVLYHLNNFQFSLEWILRCSNKMVLETEVCDSLDENLILKIKEPNYLDQSLSGCGSRPSATYIEKYLDNHNWNYYRINDSRCNAFFHRYDWKVKNTNKWENGLRRFWFCEKIK